MSLFWLDTFLCHRGSARQQEQCWGASWQASPAGERLLRWHRGFPQQDVHFAFKFSREASEEAAWLRSNFTRDVALCLLAQPAARPPVLQWASRQHRGQLFPWKMSLGGSCGEALGPGTLPGARLPRTLCTPGNRLSVRTPRDPPISTENKATSQLILISCLQQRKKQHKKVSSH